MGLGAGCNCGVTPPPGCSDQSEFVVDGAALCSVDGRGGGGACAIDFGEVRGGLSASKRLSFAAACNVFFFEAVVTDGAEAFKVGTSGFGLGNDGNEGFVFVEAQPPLSDAPDPTEPRRYEGVLSISDGIVAVTIDLGVN